MELQDGATKRDYTAREVDGAEKATWWDRAVAAWPDYARYQRKTERQIPCLRARAARGSEGRRPLIGALGGAVLRLTAGDRAFSAVPSCIRV